MRTSNPRNPADRRLLSVAQLVTFGREVNFATRFQSRAAEDQSGTERLNKTRLCDFIRTVVRVRAVGGVLGLRAGMGFRADGISVF